MTIRNDGVQINVPDIPIEENIEIIYCEDCDEYETIDENMEKVICPDAVRGYCKIVKRI